MLYQKGLREKISFKCGVDKMSWVIALAIIFGFLASIYGIVQSIQIKVKSYFFVFAVFFVFYATLISVFIYNYLF